MMNHSPHKEKYVEDSEEASSSEGEESDDGSGEESDDGYNDDEEQQKPPSSQPASKTAPPTKSESKKDEDKEEGDDEETNSDQTLKSKPEPKSTAAPARSGTKRRSAEDETKQSKKKKTTATADNAKGKEKEEDNKKPGNDSKKFQRLFSEEDEVAILEGLVEFTAKPGNDPLKYPTSLAFYELVKNSIHVPVTFSQLKGKVGKLKGKFETKMEKCKLGKTPKFSKPIEKEMFEYGKKVWGGKIGEENVKTDEKPSKKGAVKKSPTTNKLNPGSSYILNEMDQFDKSLSGVFGSNMDLKSGMELIEESKRVELETRWKELRFAELELVVMRAELVVGQGRLILDEFKSSSSH